MSKIPVFRSNVPIILVMGPTFVDKSFFIERANLNTNVKDEHDLKSETGKLATSTTRRQVSLPIRRKVSLVETMGFDNKNHSDAKTLKHTANLLASIHAHGGQLAGILYLHDIQLPAHHHSVLKNIRILEKLVGKDQYSNVTLVVTDWDDLNLAERVNRMTQLKKSHYLWGAMLDKGSAVELFDGTSKGAQNIVRKILIRNRRIILDIQNELVNKELELSETAVGKLLREYIERRQTQFRRIASENPPLSRALRNVEKTITNYQAQIVELEAENSILWNLRNIYQERMRTLVDLSGDRPQFLGEQSAPSSQSHDEIHSNLEAEGEVTSENISIALLGTLRSILSSSSAMMWKLLRPRVPPGYTRLEWACTCGEPLYGDFKAAKPGSLARLVAKLRQHSGLPDLQQGVSAPIQASRQAHPRQTQPVGWHMPDVSGSSNSTNPSDSVGNATGAASPKIGAFPPPTALQLCIETGKYSLELRELKSLLPISDGALFAKIRQQYECTHHSFLPLWARFKKPESAIFVKFRLGRRPIVSLTAGTPTTPAIPPATEVAHNYTYDPCPIDEPPIDSRTFFHHFYAPSELHPDTIWSERLPWKVGAALEPKEHGWGIHLEERPNWPLFTALMCVLLLVSGIVAGIYGWRTGDAQTGVAIGAWLTSVQVMGATAVFFWWS